ncbi:family 16 glycoside hydrolase [Paraburkholderia sp. SIMBA_054]|uniref:family 16 glycoside hydrolase n=1 Tax=Paraburkholderia sp. SIMBA_054 TaxID=3085795 RepID=UPI0039798248
MTIYALTSTLDPIDVQNTTFAKDVLSRYSCNTWDEATVDSKKIDVVIVGAGLFGGYCASKIFELSRVRFGERNTLRVLVLDAGPFLVSEHTQNIPNLGLYDPGIFNTTFSGSGARPVTRNLVWGLGWRSNRPFVGQAYCIGGKGLFWGGWCPRFQPSDLQRWPKEVADYLTVVNVGSPVGFRPIEHRDPFSESVLHRGDPLSAYETVEYEIGVVPSDDFVFDPVSISQSDERAIGLNRALHTFLNERRANIDTRITAVIAAPIAVQTQSFISGLFALDKYSSLPALIASTRADHGDGRTDLGIAVVPKAHVVRLECEQSDTPGINTGLVTRIVVQVEGQQRTLDLGPHCQTVLAASCIESTRLALESFPLSSLGLRPPNDELMGRNFMFHLRADIAFKAGRDELEKFVKTKWPDTDLAKVLQLAALHIQCEGTFGSYQFQLYAATNDGGPDANIYRMVPDLEMQRAIANGFGAETISLVLRASGEVKGGSSAPVGDSKFDYVNLAGDADFDSDFGHRRAWVQFRSDPQDHAHDEIWQEMHDTAHAIARAIANGGPLEYVSVAGTSDFTLPSLSNQQGVGSTFHDAGTLWMGDTPDQSVTDVNGHFHHIANAYCADQALFPTVGSANPALTGLCLARRVAEDIVNRHSAVDAQTELALFRPISLARSDGWETVPYDGIIELFGGSIIETQPDQRGIGIYFLPLMLDDFELSIQWKAFRLPTTANSGVFLRIPDPRNVNFSSAAESTAFYNAATEIQIDELGKNFDANRVPIAIYGDSKHKTGAIYGISAATKWAATVPAPDGDTGDRYWNTYHITANGPDVRVKLNGSLVSNGELPANKSRQGFIGLQFHTGRVQFRNCRLRV